MIQLVPLLLEQHCAQTMNTFFMCCGEGVANAMVAHQGLDAFLCKE